MCIRDSDEAVKLMTERQEHYKLEHMDDLADETEDRKSVV